MKVGYLGAGTWGVCLASILASKDVEVVSWTRDASLAEQLMRTRRHPRLEGNLAAGRLRFTTDLIDVIEDADLIVESVTSKGIRPVFEQVKQIAVPTCPIVITSKGIEQNSGLILPDVVVEVMGPEIHQLVGVLSGPGYAQEVMKGKPTSVVASAYAPKVMQLICELFTTPTFRVYPNSDIRGVAFGGALKNIIAIACGISDGLKYGNGAKAALMTRGLHEIRKLGLALQCRAETFYGLAGMGDIFLTCSSAMSRNYQFGQLLALGCTPDEARAQIGMVVEGAYSCVSALQLGRQNDIPLPITEQVYQIIYEGLKPSEAVSSLMRRPLKEEHL